MLWNGVFSNFESYMNIKWDANLFSRGSLCYLQKRNWNTNGQALVPNFWSKFLDILYSKQGNGIPVSIPKPENKVSIYIASKDGFKQQEITLSSEIKIFFLAKI